MSYNQEETYKAIDREMTTDEIGRRVYGEEYDRNKPARKSRVLSNLKVLWMDGRIEKIPHGRNECYTWRRT